MGYTTEFEGFVTIDPPLSEAERDYINKFSGTRRMHCVQGPYYVDRGGFMGQDHGPDVIEYNHPAEGQPGLWCQWEISEDGGRIQWDGGEKFYNAETWMQYIIDHFIGAKPKVMTLPATQRFDLNIPDFTGHVCNGVIDAQGEERGDAWRMGVRDNRVGIQDDMAQPVKWLDGGDAVIEPPTLDLTATELPDTLSLENSEKGIP